MKKRIWIRMTALLFVWVLLYATAALAAPSIWRIEYDGAGKVDVEFSTDVFYRGVKVKAKDKTTGKTVKAVIIERDDDDLSFRLKSYKSGHAYQFTISGIRRWNEYGYGKVKGTVRVPKSKGTPVVRGVEYDREDGELDFSFAGMVEWRNPSVMVSAGGANLSRGILDVDEDGIEVSVSYLESGRTYQYRISGVRKAGASSYTTVTGSFTAW